MRIPAVIPLLLAVGTYWLIMGYIAPAPLPAGHEGLSPRTSSSTDLVSAADGGIKRAAATLMAMDSPPELSPVTRVAVASALDTAAKPAPVFSSSYTQQEPECMTPAAIRQMEDTRKIFALQNRVLYLEGKLAMAGIWETPATRWLVALGPDEQPAPETVQYLSEYLAPYPVELSPQEGRWVIGRIEADDWRAWGPTLDEALIIYLGPARLVSELPAAKVAALREEWSEEGYFP